MRNRRATKKNSTISIPQLSATIAQQYGWAGRNYRNRPPIGAVYGCGPRLPLQNLPRQTSFATTQKEEYLNVPRSSRQMSHVCVIARPPLNVRDESWPRFRFPVQFRASGHLLVTIADSAPLPGHYRKRCPLVWLILLTFWVHLDGTHTSAHLKPK
jgi:hypothetical protein